jgi:hypothetical protein
MDRLERIVVAIALVFVMSLAVIAQDERDDLATKIDEMVGAGHGPAEADFGSRERSALNVWWMFQE